MLPDPTQCRAFALKQLHHSFERVSWSPLVVASLALSS
jgi:hypothetical protein